VVRMDRRTGEKGKGGEVDPTVISYALRCVETGDFVYIYNVL